MKRQIRKQTYNWNILNHNADLAKQSIFQSDFSLYVFRHENIAVDLLYDQVLEDQPEWINLTLEQKHDAIIALVGPKQRHSLAKIYVLTTYYSCLILVGVFGNLLTSWVISKSLVLQTPPNFYIFNLAIVDLITLLLGMYNCRGLKFWLLIFHSLKW